MKNDIKIVTCIACLVLIFSGCGNVEMTTSIKTTNPVIESTENKLEKTTEKTSDINDKTPEKTPEKTQQVGLSNKKILTSIMDQAKLGKVINCEFAVKDSSYELDVKKKWGEPDKSEFIDEARGQYLTYNKHKIVVAYGKSANGDLFEVRTFDDSVKKISYSDVTSQFGNPNYEKNFQNQIIIGYVVNTNFKILMAFKKTNSDDKFLDHYSVFYPKGTANNMAYPGLREW